MMFSFSLDNLIHLDIKKRANGVNQLEKFTSNQAFVQRVLAVSSSTTSIVFCLLAMYFFLAIDPRRRVFRHQLIFFLLFFDLMKAIILLLYPSRVLSNANSYYNDRFCHTVGFFTATAIEGADLAILSFAIHTFLLIFKPSLNTKVSNRDRDRIEGGLYIYRYYVYGLSFLIPLILASLAFINRVGYQSFVCWCYLAQQPLWYRLVLSWLPRYIIVITIFTFYCLIYFHVIKEFKKLGGVFTTIHKSKLQNGIQPSISHQKPSFFSALKYFLNLIKDSLWPKLILPESNRITANKDNSEEHKTSSPDLGTPIHVDTENIIYDPELHAANLESYRKRQKIIEKQMKSIFIYPFAYCFIWIFPFILYITQIKYEENHHPIYWLNCMGAFMQPLNGFVDSLVFFYREQPWKYTIMKNFEKDHGNRMDNVMIYTKEFDSESTATSARLTKNSWSLNKDVDINKYSKWRHCLNCLNLPFFKLPTDENISKFQMKYINYKLESYKDDNINNFNLKHDYSSILSGELTEKEFRCALETFSLDFSNRKLSLSSNTLNSSGAHIRSSIVSSSKSSRSRQLSTIGPNEPVILEGKSSIPAILRRPGNDSALSATPRNNIGSGTNINSQSGFSTSLKDSNTDSNDEIDFLEFLKIGP